MLKAHFAEMEILIKLGTQKDSIILLTEFAEKLPLISSHSLGGFRLFLQLGLNKASGTTCQGEAGTLFTGLAHHMR